MKKCLLIFSKHFYTFEKHIREELVRRGYSVEVSNDEYPEGLFGRILGKLQVPIIFAITNRIISRNYLKNKKYDLILIFKGRGMSPKLIREMRGASDTIIGYNYDSFRLNRSPLRWYKDIDKYYTFDYRDADQWSLPVIELFSSSTTLAEKGEIKYQLSSIVRNHSDRLAYIDKVLTVLNPETLFLYIFESSIFTFLFNFFRNPRLYLKYRRNIHFTPIPYSKYSEVMRHSEFTIDYAHFTQSGITMRCFEAINMKTKIITNNEYIKRSRCFNGSDCIIYSGCENSDILLKTYEALKGKPYQSNPRIISDFITELIGG